MLYCHCLNLFRSPHPPSLLLNICFSKYIRPLWIETDAFVCRLFCFGKSGRKIRALEYGLEEFDVLTFRSLEHVLGIEDCVPLF